MLLINLLLAGLLSLAAVAAVVSAPASVRAAPMTFIELEDQPRPMRADVAAYRRGLRALDSGDLEAAERAFRESFRLNDQVAAPLLGLVEVAMRRNELDTAERHLELAEKTAPDQPDVHFTRARLLINRSRHEEARQALERAIALAPGRPDLHVELGMLLTRSLGRHAEAVAALDKAIALDNDNDRAHLGRGTALLALGELSRARTAFETAGRLAPRDPVVWDMLAEVARAENDPEAALAYYQRSIAADPDRAAPHVGRGSVLAGLGDFDAAVAAFEAAAAAEPARSGAVLTRLGMVHEASGDIDAAIAGYERAIAADDRQVAAYNNLAAIMADRRERLGEALTWARRAVELRPEIPHFEDTLGWVLYANGDIETALVHIEVAAQKLPDHPQVQYHLGVLRAASGDRDGARAALETALRLSDAFPGADDARERLAALR